MPGADERDEIRARINIVDLVGQSVLLKKAGKKWKGLCPFHADKNPSFDVDPTYGTYRCWACGEHGDIFTWVMKTRHVEFVEALHVLADMAGVSLAARGPAPTKDERTRWRELMDAALAFFRDQMTRHEEARSYCAHRGLTDEILAAWEIGYAPDADALGSALQRKGHSLMVGKELYLVEQDGGGGFYDRFKGRIMFPIRNEIGDLVAFGGRTLGDRQPKYINSSDTPLYRKSRVLYGMHRAKDAIAKERRAVLVEGYLDVIACHSAGVETAVASLGTSMTEDQARLLKRWGDEVVVLYDSDPAGQKATDRAVEILQGEGLRVRVALMPEGEDPDTLLRTEGPSAVKQAALGGIDPLHHKIQKLLASRSPVDDEFWVEAVEILAGARSDLQLDRYLVQLAGMAPGATNPVSTQQALRRQVARFKKDRRTGGRDEAAPPPNPFRRARDMDRCEVAVFRALSDPALRTRAWMFCRETKLFPTPIGQELATAVVEAFPDAAPGGSPSVWAAHLEPETAREAFFLAQDDLRVAVLPSEFLEEAMVELRRRQEKRDVDELRQGTQTDQSLLEITERLRRLKGRSVGE